MDNVELRYVLDFGRDQCRCLGVGFVYVGSRALLVSSFDHLSDSCLTTSVFRRQALPAIAVGHVIIATVMVLNGTIGARLHVPFPVLNRSSFGFWFSYFSVISRVVLSMFWFGVQTFTGSECVYQVCLCIVSLYSQLMSY